MFVKGILFALLRLLILGLCLLMGLLTLINMPFKISKFDVDDS
jgi:hypothetical protein